MLIKRGFKSLLTFILVLILSSLFATVALAATVDDVKNNSLRVGTDVYDLNDTHSYTYENVLGSLSRGGSQYYFKVDGRWYDLLRDDINRLSDLLDPDKAVPAAEVRTWRLTFWYGPGDTVQSFEPIASTYLFEYDLPSETVLPGEDIAVNVTFSTDEEGAVGYDAVLFAFSADGPGNVTFVAKDSAGAEHTFTNEGTWGPEGGFPLAADYRATTTWTLNFAYAGEYTITFNLIDVAAGEIIADISDSVDIEAVWTPGDARAAFLAALETKAAAITAADVYVDGENISAVFAKDADIGAVTRAVQDLLAAFDEELKEATIIIKRTGDETGETFRLDDDGVVVAIGQYLLDGMNPSEFLAQREAIEATYTATATDNYNVSFNLAGNLKFQTVFTLAEAKAAFLAALETKAAAITAAKVTVDGENISAVFAKDADIGAVAQAVQDLLAAFDEELKEATIIIKRTGDETGETFRLDDDGLVVAIAQYLLDGMNPSEFLAQREAIEATYTSSATDNYNVSFNLVGNLKFQTVFTPAEARAAFLAALDTKAAAITAAKVTVDGEHISAIFAKDADIGAVTQAVQGLLAAFQDELKEATITIKRAGDETGEGFRLDDDGVVVAIAQYLLDGMNPFDFLAQREAIEATYTATATDNYNVSFNLAGNLKFQTVFTLAEAKAAFLAALDTKAAAITAATVTVDGENISAVFDLDTAIEEVWQAAQDLLAAFKEELQEASLTVKLGGDDAGETFALDQENVAVAIAEYLLGDLSPADFLAQRDAIEATYTATATDNYGVSFNLAGNLRLLHKYIVTFSVDGGSGVEEQIVDHGGKATVPGDPTKLGYTFVSWFADESLSDEFDFNALITCDTTIYAKWTPRNDTAYTVEHYQQNIDDDGYMLKDTDPLTGTTDEMAYAEAKAYPGFAENADHEGRVDSGTIEANGSLVMKL